MGADLFSLLTQSGQSLGAHSTALATAGNNAANANTPGYSRQIANLAANAAIGAQGPTAVGMGVSVQLVTQARDLFLERQMPAALGARARSQTESDALSSLTALNPDLEGGLTSAVGAFYGSLRTLSQNPGDLALRQAVIGTAQGLARSFSQTASAIEATRTGLDAKVLGKVDEINAAASSLAALNRQIQFAQTAGAQPNDLLDTRQGVVDKLAGLTGATPYSNANGDVSMALPGGTAMVSDARAGRFVVAPDPTNNGHLMMRLVRADGSGPSDFPGASLGGEMGGVFAARDGTLRTAVNAVDSFAFNLATSLNTIHQAGYAMDGSGPRDLFTIPATSVGAASLITVDATVAGDARLLAAATTLPAAAGDNRNIMALFATEQQALAGGADPVGTLQSIIGNFGTSSNRARAMADHDGAMATHLTRLRDSTSGVSLDEEMINLTKAQRAFEAVSKVIAAADAMLDVLMKLK